MRELRSLPSNNCQNPSSAAPIPNLEWAAVKKKKKKEGPWTTAQEPLCPDVGSPVTSRHGLADQRFVFAIVVS
jgi:hypothetical protein